MTVQELIEKLQSLTPDAEVIIEKNHGEFYPISEDQFSEETITDDYYKSFEEDEGKTKVVIREQ